MPAELRTLVALLGLIWYTALLGLSVIGCHTARRRYRLRPRSPLASAGPTTVPGVSILRPLKGLDTNLYENLESTFNQEYPNYEVLMSVADEQDQALSVVNDLVAKYPSVKARIIIGEQVVGVNPKVNNLVRSCRFAENDILWVLDSNVSVAPGTLARSVDALTASSAHLSTKHRRRIALVHHVPFAWSSEPTFGSQVEEAFMNTNHAKMYLAINAVALDSCVVGKSNLYRRSDLERVNGSLRPIPAGNVKQEGECGLPAFGRFLAEDNMVASAFWHELGDRHDLSCDVARNAVGKMSLGEYLRRRVRWIRVRKRMVMAATLLEPFTESLLLGFIAASSIRQMFAVPIWFTMIIHYAWWLTVDLDVYASLAGHPVPSSTFWSFLCAWCTREILAFPIWVWAISGDEVDWRGNTYRVLRNGEVERVPQGGSGGIRGWWALEQRNGYDPVSQTSHLN
ncbi:glycosyltransferase family 21 protein [Punctularia strigosozonata HHB-11173 SS5]|uniref:glycosyltransferase family 21 protein n=1 Tax=Punctularia strigosozonata (strain HHB-11173) TaxID=741275 RepID=UPI00044174D6|nr:glycosyltransferase family 21 protein [Punctularia strigosozonata HHB-11173 SS5]EIN14055.1 glycosyltransferase family 21 protein [Punctularia strigosozonata HHB-11173 SS5]